MNRWNEIGQLKIIDRLIQLKGKDKVVHIISCKCLDKRLDASKVLPSIMVTTESKDPKGILDVFP